MRVLVTGATGLIGAAVLARLIDRGHRVTGVARQTGRPAGSVPAADWLAVDIAAATRPEDWLPHLAGVDAVVNCAGVLQDGPSDAVRGVHVIGVGALFEACERAGVRRVVQISAIGADAAAATEFSRSKHDADAALMRRDLDWVILRPSVVLGPAAYGGSALIRGLAALPVLPMIPQTGKLQVVQLEDVVATVLWFLEPGTPARLVLDLAGPERLDFADIVRQYRAWLGWPEPRLLPVPARIADVMFRLGDLAGRLGWRSPLRSTARAEIARGSTGEPAAWTDLTGIAPQSLAAALARRPAAVQERWFAAMYLLKPVILVVLALFWTVTGLIALGPGYSEGAALLRGVGAGRSAGLAVIAGGLADVAVGFAILLRRTARLGLWAALTLSLFYLVVGTLAAPFLWAAPLGPLVKIVPNLVLNLVALAILDDR